MQTKEDIIRSLDLLPYIDNGNALDDMNKDIITVKIGYKVLCENCGEKFDIRDAVLSQSITVNDDGSKTKSNMVDIECPECSDTVFQMQMDQLIRLINIYKEK